MKRAFLVLLLLVFYSFILAADFEVRSSVNRNTLSLDDQLQYTIKISSSSEFHISEPPAPRVDGFSFRNMYSNTSSQTTFINGRKSVEISREFVYIYMPTKLGSFQISAQNIVINGISYRTAVHSLVVIKGNSTRNPGTFRSPNPRSPFGFVDPDPVPDFSRSVDDVFMLSIPASGTVYRGEPVVVSYYVYSTSTLGSFQLQNEEDFPGYGKSIFYQPDKLDFERVQYNGRQYLRALIKRLVLSPHNTGTIRVPRLSGNARLYGFGYQSKSVRSSDSQINVVAVPESSRPSNFSGAIGRFRVSDNMNQKQISLGEVVTYNMIIEGRGNFNQFLIPSVTNTSEFRVSRPQVADNLVGGVEGRRTALYTFIPLKAGTFRLPQIRFDWFDSESGTYRSFVSSEREITVKPSNVFSQFGEFLGAEKSGHIQGLIDKKTYRNYILYPQTWWFWIAVILIVGSAFYYSVQAYRTRLKDKNPALYARILAERNLNRYFREAREAAQRLSPQFYSLAEAGLMSFLSERYKLSNRLSLKEKIDILNNLHIEAEVLQLLEFFSLRCQEAKFMPTDADAASISEDFEALESLVKQLTTLNRNLT